MAAGRSTTLVAVDELIRLRALDTVITEATNISPVILFAQDRDLRYVWVHNAQAGARAERIIGSTDYELMSPAAARMLTALKQDVMATGRSQRRTVKIEMREDRPPSHFDVTLAPMRNLEGDVIGITGIAMDITTEQRQRMALDDARLAAIQADQAKSRFLAAASHDLRQPFQAMHLFLHLLDAKLTRDDQRNLSRKLGESLETGEQLLNTLLEISALESGTVVPSLADFPLDRLLRRLREEFEPQAMAEGLELRCIESAAVIRSDPVLLDRMLRNLIGNALRHTEKGRVLIGARHRGASIRIEIWDTGPGIPDDKVESVFQEFVQLADGPRDGRQGLGLGLSIVKRTGDLLNHEVGLRSKPGKGSCFSVTVPLAAAEVYADAPAAAVDTSMIDRPLVAVAEDDRLQLAALDIMLRDWNCRTITATSGDALMAKLAETGRAPDMLVTDYRLSASENGPALARRVRTAFGSEIPVLLLTGDTHPDIMAQAARDGMSMVHKPMHPNRLRRAIETATGQELRRDD